MGSRDISICISSPESVYGHVAKSSAIAAPSRAHAGGCAIGVHPAPMFTDGSNLKPFCRTPQFRGATRTV